MLRVEKKSLSRLSPSIICSICPHQVKKDSALEINFISENFCCLIFLCLCSCSFACLLPFIFISSNSFSKSCLHKFISFLILWNLFSHISLAPKKLLISISKKSKKGIIFRSTNTKINISFREIGCWKTFCMHANLFCYCSAVLFLSIWNFGIQHVPNSF